MPMLSSDRPKPPPPSAASAAASATRWRRRQRQRGLQFLLGVDVIGQVRAFEHVEDAFRRHFDVVAIADVPRRAGRRLHVKHLDGDLLAGAVALVHFEPRTPLKLLVGRVAVVRDREQVLALDLAVLDRLVGLLQRFLAPDRLLGALALDLDLRLGLVLGLLGRKGQDVLRPE